MNEMDEALKEFLVESHENLDRLDRDLIALEENPAEAERIASIFRAVHTLKGTCGFLGFSKLESVAHVGENLLSRMRDGKLAMNDPIADALLELVDAVRQMLASIEASGSEGGGTYDSLIATLTRLLEPEASTDAALPTDERAASIVDTSLSTSTSTSTSTNASTGTITSAHTAAHQAPLATPAPTLERAQTAPPHASPPAPLALDARGEQDLHDAFTPRGDHARGNVSDSSIRVDVGLLDKLMNLVGELVLARNQILQYGARSDDPLLSATTNRLNLVTTELQEGVMKTRMQPIGNIWSKFPRVVRDLARVCGKSVRVEQQGEGTDLDKSIIEAIKDPLTHIVRNSVDHGVETALVRRAAGKDVEGVIRMRAWHEGGQVNIEIKDDGAGIQLERVRQKALERGLITPQAAALMSERELLNLIFLPGFSTAAAITNVSGRGVGMDVVKTNIEKIGGTVDVQSTVGRGTTFRIKIPLTLAIIPALIVTTAGDRYAIPQVNLLELVRIEPEDAQRALEQIHESPVYRLRGNLLPLVDLGAQLGVAPPRVGRVTSAGERPINIVVVQADGRQFGLVVDEINDTEEIVVKPLGKQLKAQTSYAGATIMGDGRVSLILDVIGLAQHANVVVDPRAKSTRDVSHQAVDAHDERSSLLVFQLGEQRRVAIPLASVARLEEIESGDIELAGGKRVVQYRGEILPLFALSEILGSACEQTTGKLQVVVYTAGGKSCGLQVERIVDIVEEVFVLRGPRRAGLKGSGVLQGKVTDLLDIESVISAADPEFFDSARPVGAGA